MDDFSPAAVARKVDSLNKLLEARTQLSNLVTYMDGKTGAEELIAKTLNDPALLQTLVSAPNQNGASLTYIWAVTSACLNVWKNMPSR